MNTSENSQGWLCDPALQARLLALAESGCEITLGFYPCEFWPDEAKTTKPDDRWRCWITEVPGTDMCVSTGRASTLDEAVRQAFKELDRD